MKINVYLLGHERLLRGGRTDYGGKRSSLALFHLLKIRTETIHLINACHQIFSLITQILQIDPFPSAINQTYISQDLISAPLVTEAGIGQKSFPKDQQFDGTVWREVPE